ncbi:hypothetical protein GGU10DRAFT_363004 [Lentinula aff. detonsa]|uniref:Uncharacterized protein n=1 Tax=Lentinula aff. detonsa TaxID=2804958 RepID=A0AA38KEF7_9AGAR|nr:hypothetical protein GGU10DRAFT_363004 [Lentinula aff. detonsa]
MNASMEWWDDFPTKIEKRMFISAGDHECLDTTISFSQNMMNIANFVENYGILDSPLIWMLDVQIQAIHYWIAATTT